MLLVFPNVDFSVSSTIFFFVRQIWDSLFFDFHGLLCRLLPLDAQGTDLTKWLPLDLGDILLYFSEGGGWKNYPVILRDYAINVISMSQSHETKIQEPEPIMMVHVMSQGFVSSWWTCFSEVFVPLGRYNKKVHWSITWICIFLFGVDFVNPYCEHEIQLTIWKTAVAVNFHELAPITSKPLSEKMVLPMFSRYSFFGGGRNISIFLGQSFGILRFFYTVFRSSVMVMANQPTPLTFSPQKYGFNKCSAGY